MSDLDVVLERLVNDPTFARDLARSPATALDGYTLSEEDLSMLSTQVSFDRGQASRVEDRVSKAAMFGLFSAVAEGFSGLGEGATALGGPDTAPALGGPDTAPALGGPDTAPAGIIIPDEDLGDRVGFNPQPDPPGRQG